VVTAGAERWAKEVFDAIDQAQQKPVEGPRCFVIVCAPRTRASKTRIAQGSEMLHVWFTNDLRSAYAVHAPVPELCRDRLLARSTCRSAGAIQQGM